VLLINIPAVEATDFVEPADIVVKGQNGDLRGRWNGSDPFSIDGVEQSPGVWVEATPLGGDALLTVQPVNTLKPEAPRVVDQDLLVVSASEIELALGAISSPLTPNPTRAQVVLVAQENDEGLAGVQVSAPDAEAVIYLDNGAYTDTATETDSSGIVVLANVPPDSSYVVTLTGELTTTAVLRLVSGGVTVAAVP
jgi:hypothetical protein